jgi:TonB family protein
MQPLALLSLVAALAWAGTAMAQGTPPPASAAASAPTDRAQRDADKVFRMILMHADKPRRSAVRDDKVVATPAVATAGARSASNPPTRPQNESVAAPAKPVEPAPGPDASAVPSSALATRAVDAQPGLAALPAVEKNTRLELVQSEEPIFPARLLRTVGSGSVVVQFDVLPDGTVSQPEVVRSPHRGLNAAALAAVSAWRFKPITQTAPGIVELKFE